MGDSTESEKMNGDINGASNDDEAMDVDSQSQDESVTTSLKDQTIEEVTTADEDNDDSTMDSSNSQDPLGSEDPKEPPSSSAKDKKAAEKEKVNGHGTDDDDNAVIIQSDSDSDDVVATDLTEKVERNGRRTTDEVHEILSDKEDCVVIEDSKEVQGRPRQRKSLMKVRDYSSYDDDDIEEILEDPLMGDQPLQKKARLLPQDLSVTPVNRAPQDGGKAKEPTLVIIDTNTMLNSRTAGNSMMQSIKNASSVVNASSTSSGYSVMPVGVPAQGVYPPNIRATITPVAPQSQKSSPAQMPAPILLPALTDDMFVLEAPSFIVPYIYEKPPQDNLKEVVQKMAVELEEMRKKEESEENSEESDKESGDEDKAKEENTENAEKSAKKSKRRKKKKNPDDSWDEGDTSTDDEASDSEEQTKVLIKEVQEDLDVIKKHIITPDSTKATPSATTTTSTSATTSPEAAKKPSDNYFESPLGQFFMTIGINLVQEHVQTDLLRIQKKKRNQDSARLGQIQTAINSLMKNLEISKDKNEPFKFPMKRCEFCNFKTESALAMANHYEKPHLKNNLFTCNFCSFSTRAMHDVMFHMEALHNIKSKIEKGMLCHVCPNCPFEDNGKSKLARHALSCAKKFKPEVNLAPPMDWEPPAKIPRIKPRHGLVGTATAYQQMTAQQQQRVLTAASMPRLSINPVNAMRGRGRPQSVTNKTPVGTVLRGNNTAMRPIMPTGNFLGGNNFPMATAQNASMMQQVSSSLSTKNKGLQQQPSISITPLPRQGSTTMTPAALQAAAAAAAAAASKNLKPGQHPSGSGGKSTFVICEICDGYIKDLDQLRSHMQWIHKVKIHPKMIYNRPPLNCQKCQFRFFTDQGLERHLLGSHGLVTSSMQEAANRGQDSGRCPVCGRVYQWKLLNHVSRDHNMTLKPAHLSYKCTVCTATFGMYKQFENHVYSAHSTVAKKAMDGKKGGGGSSSSSGSHSKGGSSSGGDSLLKPLKINDEITIIPQPATKPGKSSHPIEIESHVIGE
ncbi:MOG interacting and ectopic P-granules protein 1 [Sergentomyia squamirostris]